MTLRCFVCVTMISALLPRNCILCPVVQFYCPSAHILYPFFTCLMCLLLYLCLPLHNIEEEELEHKIHVREEQREAGQNKKKNKQLVIGNKSRNTVFCKLM